MHLHSAQEELGEAAGDEPGADTAELVDEAELGQGDVEQHVVAEAGPPSGPSERQQIITTAAIGVGVVAFVGAAIILGKKLWSSQGPKVQKVGCQIHLVQAHARLASDQGAGSWSCSHGCQRAMCMLAQFAEAKQLQRESAARLNGFIDELRSGGKVDLSAKNLGEEGTAYIAEGLAFNDRLLANAYEVVAHPGPGPSGDHNRMHWTAVRPGQLKCQLAYPRNRCTAVDFSKNGIGTLGVTQLCEALKNNDMLRTFIMGTNSIGDEGAALLAGYMASKCLACACGAP